MYKKQQTVENIQYYIFIYSKVVEVSFQIMFAQTIFLFLPL